MTPESNMARPSRSNLNNESTLPHPKSESKRQKDGMSYSLYQGPNTKDEGI
jgi:hypothetical protein